MCCQQRIQRILGSPKVTLRCDRPALLHLFVLKVGADVAPAFRPAPKRQSEKQTRPSKARTLPDEGNLCQNPFATPFWTHPESASQVRTVAPTFRSAKRGEGNEPQIGCHVSSHAGCEHRTPSSADSVGGGSTNPR